MSRIRVAVEIDAPPDTVWAEIEDVASHVEWMADARRITFRGPRTQGIGTEFDCLTVIGPFRTVDRMRVVEWEPGRSMGIVHRGTVTGEGRFVLEPRPGGRTTVHWDERLRFPWYLGGALAARLARPVVGAVWRRNLRRFKQRVESTRG